MEDLLSPQEDYPTRNLFYDLLFLFYVTLQLSIPIPFGDLRYDTSCEGLSIYYAQKVKKHLVLEWYKNP